MKTTFLLAAACFLPFAANSQTNRNATAETKQMPASAWNRVYDFEKQSLPQSALEAVNRIYQSALWEKNSPELIKAMIYRLKFETAIDRHQLPGLIREMELFAAGDHNQMEQALLYSLLAEIYDQYYRSDSHRIGQRTPVAPAEAGTDMETWPADVFLERISGYVSRSLEPAGLLQKINIREYEAILQTGESSRALRPTAYDFLVHRGIDLLKGLAGPDGSVNFTPQILAMYRDLLAFRLRERNVLALLMVDLDRLDFMLNNETEEEAGKKSEAWLTALDGLEKRYAAEDFCAEILYRKAQYYYHNDSVKQAYETCLEGIGKYPAYERTGLLKNLLLQLTQSELTATAGNTVYPGQEAQLKIRYRNLDRLTVDIYRIHAPVSVYAHAWDRGGQYEKNGKRVLTVQVNLANEAPYLYSDTVITIPVEALGNYEYVIYSNRNPEYIANRQFSVSRLATVARITDGKREFLVADLLSGKPVEGASVHLYKRDGNRLVKAQTLRTDGNGLATGGKEKDIAGYQAAWKNDTSLMVSGVPWLSGYSVSESTRRLNLFTDRSVYRPGQTVYFKGIACDTKDMQAIAGDVFTVSLYDAGGKRISGMQVKSNEWGSFAGEFVLPQGALNGRFSIRTDQIAGYAYFSVEEYRRPAFDIRFERNENACRFGDTVIVSGSAHTFSGVNIQNAKAKYRITRSYHRLFRLWAPPVQVAAGEVFPDGQGRFEIGFMPEKAFKDRNSGNVSYTYTVSVSITDAKGETQDAEMPVNIGDIPYILSIRHLPDIINFDRLNCRKDKLNCRKDRLNCRKDGLSAVTVEATGLSGNPVAVTGVYSIFSLQPKEAGKLDNEKDDWLQDKLLAEGPFESGKAIPLSLPESLPSGKYRMVAEAKGAEAISADFTLFADKDKCPPAPVYEWLLPLKTECAAGENAVVVYGSSAKAVYVLYEIFKGRENKKVVASRFVLNNENRKLEIPFPESYGDGISVRFTFIKDAKVFSKSVTVLRKQPGRKLDLTMDVFRDRLLPGQKEAWKISVKDAGGKGVAGELLAAMYDASLDKIYRHDWSFNPLHAPSLPDVYMENGAGFSGSSLDFRIDYRPVAVPYFTFDAIDWFGFTIRPQEIMPLMNGRFVRNKTMEDGGDAALETAFAAGLHESRETGAQEEAPVQIRRNFNETAFFYPQLKIDEAGETLISFTVPESNTTWRFMGLAHTKDLKSGQIAREAVSRKPLMVAPNVPRFIREGDKATISATVSNLSETALSGEVGIELLDPVSGQTAIAVPEASRPFAVEAGKTVAVSWTFAVPPGMDMTAVKTVAKTAGFSDGEQHLIPVLPRRILVTESLPLDIGGGQRKTFSFDRMREKSSARQNYRLTLEFTGNPVWYAVQALPALTAPQSDDVLSWFGAYYANAVAVRIARSMPKIKQVIEAWTAAGTSRETVLQSNLAKNRELKAVLPEETPWVRDAENETEMKQKLLLLFDANRTDYLHRRALDKLCSLQTGDGGWAWFKGMTSSVAITQWILYGLKETGELQETAFDASQKAVRFIDREFKRHYDDYKKYGKPQEPQCPTTYELEYLLVRSLYNDIPLREAGEAVNFYASITEKHWTGISDLYGRAIAALFLQRSGKANTAQSIVRSLREHASRNPDSGMYWANGRAGSFFFNNAVADHVFIMKAFYETGAPTEEMDEMKLWLLKQKQTQEWKSLPGLVGAIQMLLQTGSNWLEDTGKTGIRLGSHSFDTSGGEAGTGYVRKIFDAKTITPDMSRVAITRDNAAPGWGALYWQYFEDLDGIEAAKTGLNVEKSLFAEKMTGREKILLPVTEAAPLKVGDKAVVRLVVRADRDFDYVLLKDLRASCLEPVERLSGVRRAQSAVYYLSPKDASMNYYFYNLPKGTYVLEYPLYVTREGNYSNGIATIRCLYAPEFVSHTSGGRVAVW